MVMRKIVAATALLLPVTQAALADTAPPQPLPGLVATPPAAAAPATPVKLPSLHVRCDGEPPNMSDGESIARLIGAVTLLGLFAPARESPDPDKRLFGAEGVAVCSQLLDGAKPEANGLRRLRLILARAIHWMEAKDYPAALADVEKARSEAKALNLVGNAYFDQSFGLSFDLLGARATYLNGDAAAAREIGLRTAARTRFGFYPVMTAAYFSDALRTSSPAEDAALAARDRITAGFAQFHAMRLDELGKFAEAARLRDGLKIRLYNFNSELTMSWLDATAGLSWALAGDWPRAEERIIRAKAMIDQADADGKPDSDRANVIEVMDLYGVLKSFHDGHADDARRSFGARSEWSAPSFGAIVATTRLLRAGATPGQLIGALAKTEDQLWKEREDKSRAYMLKRISGGKTEFNNIVSFSSVDEYEKVSRKVWKGDRTGVISKNPAKNSRYFMLTPGSLEPIDAKVAPDALLLDAALIAKARGFKGFVYLRSNRTWSDTSVQFGNPGDPDMIDSFYLDADAVIAELRQLIPSPEELAARDKAGKR